MLTHPFRFVPACTYPPGAFSTAVGDEIKTVDFILAGPGLRATGELSLPHASYAAGPLGFPNARFPSDHVPLVATLEAVGYPQPAAPVNSSGVVHRPHTPPGFPSS